ncbi:MAG: dihydrofolate reductase family protein [Ignavibacteriaceae bacterium]
MSKIIFAINITIDGFADHTAMIADDEFHEFYADLLDSVDVVLFGRKTYELMAGFWPNAREDPKSTKSMIKFADKFNSISKVVFSKTLNTVNWNNITLNNGIMIDEVLKMKKQNRKNISAGSLSIASALMKEQLIDEFWFLVHPIVLGKGKKLFEDLTQKTNLQLIDTRKFNSVVIVIHYQKI